jgi:N-acetylneuraminic acid mutarotase
MKPLYQLVLLLILVWGCQWEEPQEKNLKSCEKPTSVVYSTSLSNPRTYLLTLDKVNTDLTGAVQWKLASSAGTIVQQGSQPLNQPFAVNAAFLPDDTYTATAELSTVCEDKLKLESKIVVFPPSNSWTYRPNISFPSARGNCFTFTLGGKSYVGSGYEPVSGRRLSEFYEYTPATGRLRRLADFPGEARTNAVTFVIGDFAYVCTGYGSLIERNDLWQYDPINDRWTQRKAFPGEARFGAMGFSINNRGYIGGGLTSLRNGVITYFRDFWEYDPSADVWTKKAEIPSATGIAFGVGFSIFGKGYIGLGAYNLGLNQTAIYNSMWEYDPITNRWSAKANFPGSARYSSVGMVISKENTLGYVGLGRNGATYFKDFYAYDPLSNTWIRKADFSTDGKDDIYGFAVSQKGFVSIFGTFYEFNP